MHQSAWSKITFIFGSLALVLMFLVCVFWYLENQKAQWRKESIEKNQYLVQAIIDFKATYGFIPESLTDVAPEFLTVVPDDWRIELKDDRLVIRKQPGPLDNWVVYSFSNENEGWDVPGYPIVRPTRPVTVTAGEAQIQPIEPP